MFNNLSYRAAQRTEKKELDPQSFMSKWYFKNPYQFDMKKHLQEIFMHMKYNHLDINFVKYLYKNLNDGFYSYVTSNLERIDNEEIKEKFDKLSDFEKKDIIIKYPSLFILKGYVTAASIYNVFSNLIRSINLLAPKLDGSLKRTFDLINIFNDPSFLDYSFKTYQLSERKDLFRTPYLRARENDLNSLKYLDMISNYILQDVDNRKEIIDYITDQDEFLEFINYEDEELFLELYHSGFFEPEANINLRFLRYELSKRFINNENFWEAKKTNDRKTKLESKYFSDFNLPNSSIEEKKIFVKLEKLGLHAIPASQKDSLELIDDDGNNFGFKIDFLLPCNIREYNGENYTLREDIIFVGEYFGYYGEDYEKRKQRKKVWQNSFEKSLDQRCLHIDIDSDLCSVLKEKNIDSKCYPDFGGNLFDAVNLNQKKIFYVKSQMQFFIYNYLINELLWQINYNYYFKNTENFNKVKEKNQSFIDRYQALLNETDKFTSRELAEQCMKILGDYKISFKREKKIGERSLRLSKSFNIRKNPSIL